MLVLRIGELAAQTGFTAKTLRYYEDVGLLRPTRRSESGYRLYDEAAVERLLFIRRAQGVGLHLEDIGRILEISDEGRAPCAHVMLVVDGELKNIAAQMKKLLQFRKGLLALRSRMVETLESGAPETSDGCPCLQEGAWAARATGRVPQTRLSSRRA